MQRLPFNGGTSVQTRNPALPSIGFLRQSQVLRLIPISKSKLWRQVQARTFPQPVRLSQRVTVWRAEDLRRWIEQQTAAWKQSSTAPCSRPLRD